MEYKYPVADTVGIDTFYCQTKRGERDHKVVTLPSECRQRKDPYLAPWGEKGGGASWVQGLPWGY